jgi:hypothetical protein
MVPHHQPDDISQTKIQVSSTVPLNHNLPWWGQSDVIVAATAFQPRPVLQTLRAFPLTPWQWRNPDSTKVPKARFILGMDWIIDNYHIYLRLNGWMIFYNLHLPMISNWINWLIPNSAFFWVSHTWIWAGCTGCSPTSPVFAAPFCGVSCQFQNPSWTN